VLNLVCVGLLILLIDRLSYSHLLREASAQEGEGGERFQLPGKALFYVAILTFIALFSEGVLQDWATVYMRQVVAVPVAVAAVGYAGYSAAMALGWFVGDRVIAFFGERFVMRMSGALIIVGLVAALLMRSPLFAIAGFAVAGLGNSNLVPILFSADGRDPMLGPGPGPRLVVAVLERDLAPLEKRIGALGIERRYLSVMLEGNLVPG
jgi:hypothetical protein